MHDWENQEPETDAACRGCEYAKHTKLRLLCQMNDIKSDGFHKKEKRKKKRRRLHRLEWEMRENCVQYEDDRR